MKSIRALFGLAGLAAWLGCGGISSPPSAASTPVVLPTESGVGVTMVQPDDTGAAPGALDDLDDPQIAAIAETIDQVAARLAELAEIRARTPEAKRLAHDMATLHRQALSDTVTLLARLHVAPKSCAASDLFESVLQEETAMLRTLAADDFDRTYVVEQIRQQTASLGLLDRLIPSVQNPDLASALVAMRRRLEAHILMARAAGQRLLVGE
jgi:predicted outer membrane protein